MLKPIFGLPSVPDTGGVAGWIAYLEQVPLQAKIGLMVVYLVGSFLGGYVATVIASTPKPSWPAFAIAGVLIASGVTNFYYQPHSVWMVVAGLPALGGSSVLTYSVRR